MDDKNGNLAKALRPPMRSDDPRRDAAERAKQIMENVGTFGEQAGYFDFDQSIIPDGWSYEWKTYSILGAVDPSRQIELARMGWEPVPTLRHPGMMPGETKEKNIIRKGMQLMERPAEITDFAKKRDSQAAREQMRSKKEQVEGAPRGPFDPTNKGAPMSKIKAGYAPMAIPD